MFRSVLAALLAASSPGLANAATTIEGEGEGYVDGRERVNLGTGRYRVVFSFDQAVTDAYVFALQNLSYDFYDPADPGAYLGGNDIEYYSGVSTGGISDSLIFRFTVERPYNVCGGWECESGVYSVSAIEYGFYSDTRTAYSVDVQYLGAVPEPGVWVLMILGFGLVGAGMRTSGRRMVQSAERASTV